jgi:hypothetical protein
MVAEGGPYRGEGASLLAMPISWDARNQGRSYPPDISRKAFEAIAPSCFRTLSPLFPGTPDLSSAYLPAGDNFENSINIRLLTIDGKGKKANRGGGRDYVLTLSGTFYLRACRSYYQIISITYG